MRIFERDFALKYAHLDDANSRKMKPELVSGTSRWGGSSRRATFYAPNINAGGGLWPTPTLCTVTHIFCRSSTGFPSYRRDWLLPDVLAGLALWAVMVPEGMAYAGIVGVPPIMGLYTIVPALLAYALLGSSRQLVVGPDTATGLISAVTVGAIATQGTAEFNALTSTLAVLIGFFFLSLLGSCAWGGSRASSQHR